MHFTHVLLSLVSMFNDATLSNRGIYEKKKYILPKPKHKS